MLAAALGVALPESQQEADESDHRYGCRSNSFRAPRQARFRADIARYKAVQRAREASLVVSNCVASEISGSNPYPQPGRSRRPLAAAALLRALLDADIACTEA